MNLIKRYSFFLVTIFAISTLYIVNKEIGLKAATITLSSFKEMIMVIPPIFILLGLLDIWVSKEIMVKYMGEGSGIKGVLIAILIGSAAAGPLYAGLPDGVARQVVVLPHPYQQSVEGTYAGPFL